MKKMNFNIIQNESENTSVTLNLQVNGGGANEVEKNSSSPKNESSYLIGDLISEHLKRIQNPLFLKEKTSLTHFLVPFQV